MCGSGAAAAKRIITTTLLVYTALSYGFGFFVDIHTHSHMSYQGKLFIYGLPMFLLFAELVVLVILEKDAAERQKTARKMMWLLFILYAVAISTLFFFDRNAREVLSWEFRICSLNLVPFKTILSYFNVAINTPRNALVNVGGNLIALSPLGVFVPFLFGSRINKLWRFALLVVIIVISIESIQFLSNVGSADIDDVILNALGATAVYIIYKKIAEPVLGRIGLDTPAPGFNYET